MKWSMDTHKFMSEITRKALQIIVAHGVTSESEPEEIDSTERELASAGIYKDFDSANGRIRRALFTYFKAYGCLNENERLTEMGRLFAENKITVQEMCFHYVLNYKYKDDDTEYFPVQLILRCLKMLAERGPGHAYISAYDFSQLVECDSITDVNPTLIDSLIDVRRGAPIEVNERNIGYDVWSNMLIKAGIVNKTVEKTLIAKDNELIDWILSAYDHPQHCVKGKIISGVLQYLPTPVLNNPGGDVNEFVHEGRALQAYLFAEGLNSKVIGRYVYLGPEERFEEMINMLGLDRAGSFYKHFSGLEHLVGYCLSGYTDNNIQIIGRILSSVELRETELTEVIPEEIVQDYDTLDRLSGGANILLYGVPGSGKSWTIEHEYCHTDSRAERLVFHPDYTNADFIGQILPVLNQDKMVTYEFVPGPFTTIIKEAYVNPLREHILIIEEVNRGNAPAIFGEVFQLLDRSVDEKDNFPVGTSEYGISHAYMAKYIYGNPNHKVRIPSNLSIICTMNTSDQNVFTLDTAFKRRWEMKCIPNDFENCNLKDIEIGDTGITWRLFAELTNEHIINTIQESISNEDKRLGAYFVNETQIRNKKLFAEKVLAYLWDDVFKYDRSKMFNRNIKTLEDLINKFSCSGKGDFSVLSEVMINTFVDEKSKISL